MLEVIDFFSYATKFQSVGCQKDCCARLLQHRAFSSQMRGHGNQCCCLWELVISPTSFAQLSNLGYRYRYVQVECNSRGTDQVDLKVPYTTDRHTFISQHHHCSHYNTSYGSHSHFQIILKPLKFSNHPFALHRSRLLSRTAGPTGYGAYYNVSCPDSYRASPAFPCTTGEHTFISHHHRSP